jgi:hypothetical protein
MSGLNEIPVISKIAGGRFAMTNQNKQALYYQLVEVGFDKKISR